MLSKAWILKHMIQAVTVACNSKDDSTQCGAVIVRPDNSICSTGYNGFPRGVKDTISSRNKRPTKYLYTVHAERNAIYNSHDPSLAGYSLFIYTYPKKLFICSICAGAIIQAGITDIYASSGNNESHWEESCDVAKVMFNESGVNIHHPDLPDFTALTDVIESYK